MAEGPDGVRGPGLRPVERVDPDGRVTQGLRPDPGVAASPDRRGARASADLHRRHRERPRRYPRRSGRRRGAPAAPGRRGTRVQSARSDNVQAIGSERDSCRPLADDPWRDESSYGSGRSWTTATASISGRDQQAGPDGHRASLPLLLDMRAISTVSVPRTTPGSAAVRLIGAGDRYHPMCLGPSLRLLAPEQPDQVVEGVTVISITLATRGCQRAIQYRRRGRLKPWARA